MPLHQTMMMTRLKKYTPIFKWSSTRLTIKASSSFKVTGMSRLLQMPQKTGKHFRGPYCTESTTNDRGLSLLEFASDNDLVLANTVGEHNASRGWTWHSTNGQYHSQMDYFLVKNRNRTGTNRAKTRTFPGADVGSDHDLVMMNFKVRLKNSNKNVSIAQQISC
eukprot:TRINITY_DN43904_c0_g1_i2.p1 TRINITY_DN43904_c0_g1~~TRINITY_DN43904_c0_g1_i2.p1  ORF type:complete len:164 (-),score=18.29 TRINITY_DN43904_c0_g1_i2:83-574(-)